MAADAQKLQVNVGEHTLPGNAAVHGLDVLPLAVRSTITVDVVELQSLGAAAFRAAAPVHRLGSLAGAAQIRHLPITVPLVVCGAVTGFAPRP